MGEKVQGRLAGRLRIDYGPRGKVQRVYGSLSGFLFQEGKTWVAYCRELDVSSCGATTAEALRNVQEAIELFFESCVERGTIEAALSELGWVCDGPDHTIADCREHPIPRSLLPAFMIDRMRKSGTDWSTRISFGK